MILRVAHVIPSVGRSQGGPSQVVQALLPALVERGLEVVLFTTDKDLDADDLPSVPALVARLRVPRRLNYAPEMAEHLASHLGDVDLVHVHGINSYPSTVGMRAARRAGIPVVLQPHGAMTDYHASHNALIKQSYTAMFDQRHLRHAARVLVSSPREAAQTAKRLPRGTLIVQSPLGVSDEIFAFSGRKPADIEPTVLFLGRLTAKKRLDRVLAAFASVHMRSEPYRLVIAGAPDSGLPYDPIDLANRLGIAHRVDFVGAVGRDDREALLRTAGVFVLPSDDESFGLAAAEAMAAGLTVVATAEVGLASRAAAAGALVLCSGEAEDLGAKLRALLSSAETREAIGKAARAYAVRHFSWSAIASTFEGFYRDILAEGGGVEGRS